MVPKAESIMTKERTQYKPPFKWSRDHDAILDKDGKYIFRCCEWPMDGKHAKLVARFLNQLYKTRKRKSA